MSGTPDRPPNGGTSDDEAADRQRAHGGVYPRAAPARLGLSAPGTFGQARDHLRAWFGGHRPVPACAEPEAPPPDVWGTPPDGMGICLSGGGIRSASFCLGALQTMERHGMLFDGHGGAPGADPAVDEEHDDDPTAGDEPAAGGAGAAGDAAADEDDGTTPGPAGRPMRAKYLSSVSGGSYIATALTLVTRGRIRWNEERGDPSVTPPTEKQDGEPDLRPFAPGSPEERLLRNRTLYLTHGRSGIPGVLWRVLLGILFNVTAVTVALAFVALPLGWLYGWVWPALKDGCPAHCPSAHSFQVPADLWYVVAGVGGFAVLSGFVWLACRFTHNWSRTMWGVVSGTFAVVTLVLLLFGIGIPELIGLARPHSTVAALPSAAGATRNTVAGLTSAGLLGLLVAWVAAVKRLVGTPTTIEKGIGKAALDFVERHRVFAINVAATVAGPLLVLAGVAVLAYAGAGTAPGWSTGGGRAELFGWLGCVVLIVLIWLRADVTQWSLYPFYRRRLSAAFVTGRIRRGVVPSPTSVGCWDAAQRPYSLPYRLSQCQPDGFPEVLICATANVSDYGATPSGSHASSFVFSSVSIGGPLVGAVPTSEYERKTGDKAQGRFTTLPTAMALSGAAISPSMGAMTRAPFRFFIALANLRLGVWIPNPRRLDVFEKHAGKRFRQVLPGPQYFLRELIGRNHLDAPFLYVTDGGHYDNLGLVELLRRKCKTIWCLDASGDKIDTFDTLGGALRRADAELGVRVAINPQGDMAPAYTSATPRYVRAPFSRGTITYPDGSEGTLVVVKAGVPRDAPWGVRSFYLANPEFPCDTTLDQLYDAERFDAYRELGAFCMEQAIARWGVDQLGSTATGTA